MKRSRFYYSTPQYEARVIVTTDNEGNPVVFPMRGQLKPRPRTTICGILDTETNVLSFGAAVCSSKDRFERKIGRQLSEDRAANHPLVKVQVTKDNIADVFIQTALELEYRIANMRNLELKGNL